MGGTDWTRTIVHWRGHYFAVLDRIEALASDEYNLTCRWRGLQRAALDSGAWVARSPTWPLNVLWSGVGNLAVGDKRGWGFVFINIVVFALSFFTLFVPCLLFFAYCCYAGYQYLIGIEAAGADRP